MKMLGKSPWVGTLHLVFLLWMLITMAALVQMQRLWWNRERVWYLGKDVHEQRTRVFKYAGLPFKTLKDFRAIDSIWPLHVHYTAAGDHNTLSYGTYLLIPRIPSGGSAYTLRVEGSRVRYSGKPSPVPVTRSYPEAPNGYGFVLSIFLVAGAAFPMRRIGWLKSLTVPERLGVSCFLLMACTLISTGLFQNAGIGFKTFALGGMLGWGCFLFKGFKTTACGPLMKRLFRRFRPEKIRGSSAPGDPPEANRTDSAKKRPPGFSLMLYLIGFFLFLWAMQMAVVTVPDDWDAWAIWGAKAKVLALGKGPLKDVTYFGHADYPLLWPSVWAFSGWCAGGWEEHWSKGWSVLFMALTAWEIGILIRNRTRRSKPALFGAVFFLSIPMVPLVASWAYAETALSLMMICSFGCLLRWRDENRWALLVSGAVFAAAAAYAKNEGLLFALLGLFWVAAFAQEKRGKAIGCYLLVVGALYAPWYLWSRVLLELHANTIQGISWHPRAILYAFKQMPEALALIGRMWKDVRQWNLALALIGIAVVWYLARGNPYQRLDILLPLGMLLGYLFIIAHYHKLWWHIGTAWNRLTVQTLPLFIVAVLSNHKPQQTAGQTL